jgi:hypothetical protein
MLNGKLTAAEGTPQLMSTTPKMWCMHAKK